MKKSELSEKMEKMFFRKKEKMMWKRTIPESDRKSNVNYFRDYFRRSLKMTSGCVNKKKNL